MGSNLVTAIFAPLKIIQLHPDLQTLKHWILYPNAINHLTKGCKCYKDIKHRDISLFVVASIVQHSPWYLQFVVLQAFSAMPHARLEYEMERHAFDSHYFVPCLHQSH